VLFQEGEEGGVERGYAKHELQPATNSCVRRSAISSEPDLARKTKEPAETRYFCLNLVLNPALRPAKQLDRHVQPFSLSTMTPNTLSPAVNKNNR
jgi:hypothetical protein